MKCSLRRVLSGMPSTIIHIAISKSVGTLTAQIVLFSVQNLPRKYKTACVVADISSELRSTSMEPASEAMTGLIGSYSKLYVNCIDSLNSKGFIQAPSKGQSKLPKACHRTLANPSCDAHSPCALPSSRSTELIVMYYLERPK